MVIWKLDIHIEKNEIGPVFHHSQKLSPNGLDINERFETVNSQKRM